MIFRETVLSGVFIIEVEPIADNRGFFARTFCVNEFAELGISFNTVQCSISHNLKRGTLRGLHYQCSPHEESKIVRCTKGGIYDVIVDIRPQSPTFKQWVSVELNESNNRSVYIPKGCAHGFQSLVDQSVVLYQMDAFYRPECARGVNYNDPQFKIAWPIEEKTISPKDLDLSCLGI